jgi:hypothetical protein
MNNFLKTSQPADPPNTPSEASPSTSMAMNAKLNIAYFSNQLNPPLCHCNHLLHHHLQPCSIKLNDSSITSPIHPFSKPSNVTSVHVNFNYFFILM